MQTHTHTHTPTHTHIHALDYNGCDERLIHAMPEYDIPPSPLVMLFHTRVRFCIYTFHLFMLCPKCREEGLGVYCPCTVIPAISLLSYDYICKHNLIKEPHQLATWCRHRGGHDFESRIPNGALHAASLSFGKGGVRWAFSWWQSKTWPLDATYFYPTSFKHLLKIDILRSLFTMIG